jgi:MoaA/NifB/PqqE/SkfB family radical SAM enzyme
LRCKICFEFGEDLNALIKEEKPEKTEDLPFDNLIRLIEEVHPFKPTLYLSGGEPLIYTNILELIEFIKEKHLYCLINTNGILLKEFAQALVNLSVDKLVVSIDGPEEAHNRNRGKTFNKIVEGIKYLNTQKRIRKTIFPLIRINSLITPFNSEHLIDMVDIAEELEAETLSFQHPMFANEQMRKSYVEGKRDKAINGINILGFTYEGSINIGAILEQAKIIESRKSKLTIYFYPSITLEELPYYYNNLDYEFKKVCYTPWRKVVVTPRGDIGPCVHYPLGNITRDRFKTLWNSPRYKTFRNTIKKKGLFSGCERCCLREY